MLVLHDARGLLQKAHMINNLCPKCHKKAFIYLLDTCLKRGKNVQGVSNINTI